MSDVVADLSVLVGLRVSKIDVVSVCHMLRLTFSEQMILDIPSGWRLRNEGRTLLGSSNIDFYVEIDDNVLDADDKHFSKKASSLLKKELLSISHDGNDLTFKFSGGLFVDFFCLTSDGLSIPLREV